MNTFTDIVFIFVFIFVILHFGIINIRETNVVWQKLYIFIAVTFFASLLYVMKSIRRQTPIDTWNVINNGLFVGLMAFIGHTLLIDMLYMRETHDWIISLVDDTFFTWNILLCLFICSSVAVGKSVICIFNTDTCNM